MQVPQMLGFMLHPNLPILRFCHCVVVLPHIVLQRLLGWRVSGFRFSEGVLRPPRVSRATRIC